MTRDMTRDMALTVAVEALAYMVENDAEYLSDERLALARDALAVLTTRDALAGKAAMIAGSLNAGSSQVDALHAAGIDPDDAYTADSSVFDWDDPDNGVVDLGWENGTSYVVRRVAGLWLVATMREAP